MKYICTIDPAGKLEIFTFPMIVEHICMAEMLHHIKDTAEGDWKRIRREPLSAGFVDAAGECWGASTSLGIESRPAEDTALLRAQFNL